MEPEYSVYVMRDPYNGEARYVGVTTSPRERLLQHLAKAKYLVDGNTKPEQRAMKEWLGACLKSGTEPSFEILCVCDDRELAYTVEKSFQVHWRDSLIHKVVGNPSPLTRAELPLVAGLLAYTVRQLKFFAGHICVADESEMQRDAIKLAATIETVMRCPEAR